MNETEIAQTIAKVLVSGMASVGIMEYLKNYLKNIPNFVWALIMPVISSACYCACEFLPTAVIGSILTVGAVQLDYQIFVQGFKKLLDKFTDKAAG